MHTHTWKQVFTCIRHFFKRISLWKKPKPLTLFNYGRFHTYESTRQLFLAFNQIFFAMETKTGILWGLHPLPPCAVIAGLSQWCPKGIGHVNVFVLIMIKVCCVCVCGSVHLIFFSISSPLRLAGGVTFSCFCVSQLMKRCAHRMKGRCTV